MTRFLSPQHYVIVITLACCTKVQKYPLSSYITIWFTHPSCIFSDSRHFVATISRNAICNTSKQQSESNPLCVSLPSGCPWTHCLNISAGTLADASAGSRFLDAHGRGEEVAGGERPVLGLRRQQTQPRRKHLRHGKPQVGVGQQMEKDSDTGGGAGRRAGRTEETPDPRSG